MTFRVWIGETNISFAKITVDYLSFKLSFTVLNSVNGDNNINGDGVWCYQIPMNLDYMMTDEYGNMVPTDDPEKGIPTRRKTKKPGRKGERER